MATLHGFTFAVFAAFAALLAVISFNITSAKAEAVLPDCDANYKALSDDMQTLEAQGKRYTMIAICLIVTFAVICAALLAMVRELLTYYRVPTMGDKALVIAVFGITIGGPVFAIYQLVY